MRIPLALACVLVAAPARADDDGFLHRLAAEVHAKLAAASAARAPTVVPPVPIEVRWHASKLASIPLGAPLVALAAADLDGDGKAELYAVTPREVIAYGVEQRRLVELGRVPFTGEPAARPPRDVVGTAIVDGGALVASVSTFARGLRVTWKDRHLVGDPGEAGFALCPGRVAQLATGRNYFGTAAAGNYGEQCRDDLVDPRGYPLHVHAALSLAGRLELVAQTCEPGGGACREVARYAYDRVGIAYALADVDRDGRPELIYSAAVAPGDPDTITAVTLGERPSHAHLVHRFAAGGVAGVAVADFDGDGRLDTIAAVRLVGAAPGGAPNIDLWRLE